MKRQAFNPYLPSWEYIPDGEPHIFGDRVYLYGSHDAFGGSLFCLNDYVCWSAPVNDLSDWRCEGVTYKKTQDPINRSGRRALYAPDVTQGPDGRFYLYYAFDILGEIGVAVSDTPAGRYRFYGKVHHANGKVWGRTDGEHFPFDPGVLTDDDGRVWLYSGFGMQIPAVAHNGHELNSDGGVVLELEPDMVTIKQEPKLLFPIQGREGAFPHPFFEASSIRKVDGKYCFVYCSTCNHDLCYAMSDRPDGGFVYGGVLVDIGDVGLHGVTDERHANNYLGTTHGGLLNIGDDWYIFYHRQTNRSGFSRQACAEKLERTPDGGFKQAEVTSCGLNGKPLVAKGTYEARIACNLWAKGHITGHSDGRDLQEDASEHPYFTQTGEDRECDGDQYVANMRDGATAGFKYFTFDGTESTLSVTGRGEGAFTVSTDPDGRDAVATVPVNDTAQLQTLSGKQALYFRYHGSDAADFISFTIQ